MSIIYPGNYVAQLNAYRGQGVEAIPGYEFYSLIGVGIVTGPVAKGAPISLKILSPDLRQDDKPRLDKPCEVPAGFEIYARSINAYNLELKAEAASAAALTAPFGGGPKDVVLKNAVPVSPATKTVELVADAGSTRNDLDLKTFTAAASATTIEVTANQDLVIADEGDQAYVMVEVGYWRVSPPPTSDDVHVPFKVEAGQGT